MADKYNIHDAIGLFFTESREMLDDMETYLLNLEKNPDDSESINALFRSAHTIKGSSGMFGLADIEKFTHSVENVLDNLRNGKISISQDFIGLLLDCHDFMKILIDTFEKNEKAVLDSDIEIQRDSLLSSLSEYSKSSVNPPSEDSSSPVNKERNIRNECYHISLRLNKDVFQSGIDPQSAISYLKDFGDILNIIPVYDDMPNDENMDPEKCYLGFEISYKSQIDKSSIENIFEFLKEDCEIKILPPRSSINDYVNLIYELPETPMKIGDMLVNIGAITKTELDQALKVQTTASDIIKEDTGIEANSTPIGEILIKEKMLQKTVVDAALNKQKEIKIFEDKKNKTIRIDAEKLDSLINLVGELVISGATVKQLSGSTGNTELAESVSTMSRLIDEVRDSTMNIRMVQIGETFKKFERVVRDLSRENGKEIDLIVSGADTELDKTVIEKISDPIMHLIRNSIDHGIGTPDERAAMGKPRRGTIYLDAYHETGSIVIEVMDDGEGLKKDKIRSKAIEKELIKENDELSDSDLYQLIFEPGFSTAEKITNVSGRGVGMDVVKKNIESLRGIIDIETEQGEGTTISIHLPLTLAIIEGFMVQVGTSYYILPLDMVTECIEVSKEQMAGMEGGNYLNLRGSVLPFMRLRKFFSESESDSKRENIVVAEYGKKKAGLAVDKLIGEFQTVIKPLGKIFKKLEWVTGATILGTGEVALILDVPMLVQHVQKLENR